MQIPCTYVACERRLGFLQGEEGEMQTILFLFQSNLDLNSKPANALK